MSIQEPTILKIIESGEVSDEIDYMVNSQLMQERGMGYTACNPSLVEIDLEGNPTQVIKMGIDHTYVDSETGQVMGYGIVGHLYFKAEPFEMIYITPAETLEAKVKYILESDMEASVRPKGKY
jgi:hypothetical protein